MSVFVICLLLTLCTVETHIIRTQALGMCKKSVCRISRFAYYAFIIGTAHIHIVLTWMSATVNCFEFEKMNSFIRKWYFRFCLRLLFCDGVYDLDAVKGNHLYLLEPDEISLQYLSMSTSHSSSSYVEWNKFTNFRIQWSCRDVASGNR